jgi:hypothetical protein
MERVPRLGHPERRVGSKDRELEEKWFGQTLRNQVDRSPYGCFVEVNERLGSETSDIVGVTEPVTWRKALPVTLSDRGQ